MSRKSVQCIAAVAVIGLAWLAPTAVEAQTGPDLGISGLVAVSGLYGITPPGWPLSLSATVRNDGDGDAAATTLRYYRSTDATIATSDTSVGTDAVGGLAAGATSPESISLTVPATAGTYYYGACVDTVTGESDTTNNCSSAVSVTVSAPPPPPQTNPDLEVQSPSVNDSSLDTGDSFTLSATVRNDGDGAAAATTLRYYRSTDGTITTSDTSVGTDAVGGLSAGATSPESVDLTVPATAGTYYYGACVDTVAGESDTTNNCSTSVQIVVLATAQQELEPKPPGEVQAVVDEAVARAGGLRAGGAPVTIELSTLFSFGAGGSAGTTYTARSSDPELVTSKITDGQLVLTPGNPPPAGAPSSLAVGTAAGDPVRVMITVTAVRGGEMAEVELTVDVLEPATGGGGGGGGAPSSTVPGAPPNLQADGGDEQVTLMWDAPEDDGGSEIADYEYRINGQGDWISIGSTNTTYTVTGLVNGTAYVFQVRALNRIGRSGPSLPAEATPIAQVVLDLAHFANGAGIISEVVLVNVAPHPIRPALYFYDQEGEPIAAESMVDVLGDLGIQEDGGLTIRTEMEPLGELTISTHGRGDLVSGSVKVAAYGAIGGVLRFDLPGIGVAGVQVSQPLRDAIFPVRRREGGIDTGMALHNREEEAAVVSCRLMKNGAVLEEVEITLAANGQVARFIGEVFTGTDTSDFVGLVRCTAEGVAQFTGMALELDAGNRIFTTLPVVKVNRGRAGEAALDFAHFANGASIVSEMVFMNLETQPSGPPLTPFHQAIPPTRPVIYFYDQEGNPIDPALLVDLTGDLEITEDGALSIQSEMEPLGELTISTYGRGELVSGSVRVVSDGPIGGVLRFDLPGIGVAGVGASQPVRDALFPARRQAGGISTAAAIHNLEANAQGVACQLMKGGVVLEETEIPLVANGQQARFIEEVFPRTDTSDFVGSVRCTAPEGGRFTGVAVELDAANRIFTTLPVVPVPERMSQE